jgi:hypothetical protein
VNKNEFRVRVQSIMNSLETRLSPVKARYFDPMDLCEYFQRFASIRSALKTSYPKKFEDLIERDFPKSSGTSDYEGRGYIRRRDLEILYEDCRYVISLLEVLEDPEDNEVKEEIGGSVVGSVPEIFISHASKDYPLVQLFVERLLRLGMDIKSDRIFCTSLDGMDIKNGEDFRGQIKLALSGAKIVILIITANYKSSEVCQNEMGAAWYSGKLVIPLIVEPITYESVGVVMQPLQIPRISDPKALSKLRDDINGHLKNANGRTATWDAGKEAFLSELPLTLKKITFTAKKTSQEIEIIESENLNLKEKIAELGGKMSILQVKYDEVVKVKDIEIVKKIEDMHDDRTELEKFEEITKRVWNCLKPMSNIVKAIALCSYFGLPYSPPAGQYSNDLQTGERRRQIFYDGDQFEVNDENQNIQELYRVIKELEIFLENCSDEFQSQYDSEYKAPLELKNEDFWEELFSFKVPT